MKDYGCDPLGNGKYRMVPSGDIVDLEERCKRIPPVDMLSRESGVFARTWDQIEDMQGGKLKR